MESAHRTQIYLDPADYRAAVRYAAARSMSLAAVIRAALAEYLRVHASARTPAPGTDPIDGLVGIYAGEGPGDVAERHDQYLVAEGRTAYGRRRKSRRS